MMLAVFVILVCGLAALVYFISVRRGMSPDRPSRNETRTSASSETSRRPGNRVTRHLLYVGTVE